MNPAVELLFHDLADLTDQQRLNYYQKHHTEDTLREEVEALITADKRAHTLATPVAESARQAMADLETTLRRTIELGADRIALFGYAHVPHLLPRQRRIDGTALPDQAARFAMAAMGYALLVDEGYVPVGFDHFARLCSW